MELRPQSLSTLLRRMVVERARTGAIFDLPERGMWKGGPHDLSVRFHGARAATPVGPAAGPQSQLAQNLVLAWLAGARVMELKTVQIMDTLQIPRPCIDATNVGYNVEWSQELKLEESLEEYAKGWWLLHALRRWNPLGLRAEELDTVFDLSVGYSLEGIQNPRVARWIDGMRDAGPLLAKLDAEVDKDLRFFAPGQIPSEMSTCLTLSTFHGCPADEIEKIVEHLIRHHGLDVVVKLNPTLLGYERVDSILHDTLGYDKVRLHRKSFDDDLQWDHALQLIDRLDGVAKSAGRKLGVKFTNTLVVENHKDFFPSSEKLMYLSGAPLHVLAITLAAQWDAATNGRWPISFSAGIDKQNVADVVACGIVPVTTCTDLLRPGGYARLAKYMENLEEALTEAGARTIGELVEHRGGARAALAAYATRVIADPRYAVAKNSSIPRRIGKTLALFDCINCDKCVPVCPNDSNFTVETPHVGPVATVDLVVGAAGAVEQRAGAEFKLADAHQLANYADFCNECGNCDVFCPEWGGPYKVKPRFFGTEATYLEAKALDGFVVAPDRMKGRIDGVEHTLTVGADGHDELTDGVVRAKIEAASGRVVEVTATNAPAGHTLPTWKYHAMRALHAGVLAGVNPVSAPFLKLT